MRSQKKKISVHAFQYQYTDKLVIGQPVWSSAHRDRIENMLVFQDHFIEVQLPESKEKYFAESLKSFKFWIKGGKLLNVFHQSEAFPNPEKLNKVASRRN